MQYKPVDKGLETIEDDQNKERKCKRKLYVCYNIVMSMFILPALPVAMWRGTWSLMDTYRQYFPPIPACLAGQFIIIVLEFWRRWYGHLLVATKKDPNCDIIIKVCGNDFFNHLNNIGAVMFWRILWECMNVNGSKWQIEFF